MDAIDIVLDFEPVLDVNLRFIEAVSVGTIDQFFFQGAHKMFCQTVLSEVASVSHADANVEVMGAE